MSFPCIKIKCNASIEVLEGFMSQSYTAWQPLGNLWGYICHHVASIYVFRHNFWTNGLLMTISVSGARSRNLMVPFVLTYNLDIWRSWPMRTHILGHMLVFTWQSKAKEFDCVIHFNVWPCHFKVMVFAKSRWVLFVLLSTNRSTCSSLICHMMSWSDFAMWSDLCLFLYIALYIFALNKLVYIAYLHTNVNVFYSHFADGPCDSEWESYNNRCYLFVNTRVKFNIAARACQGQDATLVSVADEEENKFIT